MILSCNFEELRALASGAELLLAAEQRRGGGAVAAPSEALVRVGTLRDELDAPLDVPTLADQRVLHEALELISSHLRARMENTLIEFHPGHETAIHLYFDYGHSLGVLARLERIGDEMRAIIELMTGEAVTDEAAESISFE